jgi:O-antigen/teichoic acid export membrane protein
VSTIEPAGRTTDSETPADGLGAAKRGVARGTTLQLAGTAATMATGFFATPFFVHQFGTAGYGVYSLVLVFTFAGYFGYLDFGLQSAAVFRAAPHAAAERWGDFARVIASAGFVLGVLGLIFAAALAALAHPLAHSVFAIPPHYQGAFVDGLRVVAFVILIQFPGLAFVGALQTVHRWDAVTVARTGATLAGVGVALLLVWRTHNLLALVIPVVAAPGVAALALAGFALRRIPGLAPTPTLASFAEVRELFRYGRMMFVSQAGIAIVANLDQPLIAGLVSARALGLYAIAATIYYGVFTLLPITNSTVFAATSFLQTTGDEPRLKALTVRGARYAASLTLSAVAAAMLFGPRFIEAWVGRSYHESGVVLRIWLTHMPITVFTGVLGTVLMALGRVRTTALISVASVVLNVVASVGLAFPYGLRGIVIGTVITYIVTGPVLIMSTLRAVQVSPKTFLKQAVLPSYAAGLAAAVVGAGILLALDPTRLVPVVAAAGTTFAFGVLTAFTRLPEAERDYLVRSLRLRRRPTG